MKKNKHNSMNKLSFLFNHYIIKAVLNNGTNQTGQFRGLFCAFIISIRPNQFFSCCSLNIIVETYFLKPDTNLLYTNNKVTDQTTQLYSLISVIVITYLNIPKFCFLMLNASTKQSLQEQFMMYAPVKWLTIFSHYSTTTDPQIRERN